MNRNQEPSKTLDHPKAFVSYAWDGEVHRDWVHTLAARLRGLGVDVTLDQWSAAPGDRLPFFMEQSIRLNDFILIICTPKYKEKSENRSGGVGYEGDVMTGELLVTGNHRKFIPILREGEWAGACPSWLLGKYFVDLRGNPYSEQSFSDLLAAVCRDRTPIPELGTLVQPHSQTSPQRSVNRLNLLRDLEADDKIGFGSHG